jgi:hypothetical protein
VADDPKGLRCGDLNAANIVIKHYANATGTGDEDPSVVDPDVGEIVSQLVALQQTRETIFGGGGADLGAHSSQWPKTSLLNPTQSIVQCRRRVADSYERTKTRSSSSRTVERPHAHYRTACLAMLGGSESISEAPMLEASGLVTTVEDYLYASLWHAVHLADVPPSGGGSEGELRKVAEAVARLASLVKEWGPTYFEQDELDANASHVSASAAVTAAARGSGITEGVGSLGGPVRVPRSGGWAFALPLLASQQYETALAYLAEVGGGLGLLQATHIGVAMDTMGMSLGDFSMEEQSNASSSRETILPMLVASYSASLQGLDVSAALKYLVLLSGKGKFVKEQVRIQSPCDQLERIRKNRMISHCNPS